MYSCLTKFHPVLELHPGHSPGLSYRRDHAQLLHHAQVVAVRPEFKDLPVLDAKDVDSCCCEMLAGRWDAKKLALMGAASGKAFHHLFSFDDHVISRGSDIRESFAEEYGPLLDALAARC